MSGSSGALVVLLVGSSPGRVEDVRTAVASADSRVVVAGAVDPAAAIAETPDCDCLLVEVPVDDVSLAALRAATWTGEGRVPVVPFAVDGAAADAFDVHRVATDELGAVVGPVERAVAAGGSFEPTQDAVLAATTDVLLAVSPSGTVRYATPAVEDLVGEPAAAVVGSSLLSYVHPDDRTPAVERIHRNEQPAFEGAAPVRFRNAVGDWAPVVLERRGPLGDSPQDGMVVLARSAETANAAVGDGADRLYSLDDAADPMCFITPDGVLDSVNGALSSFLGRDREDLVGTHVSAFIGDEQYESGFDRLVPANENPTEHGPDGGGGGGDDPPLASAERSGAGIDPREDAEEGQPAGADPVTYEFTIERDGDVVWCEALLSPVFESGSAVGTIGLIHDITERKAREQQLSKYETIAEDTPIALFTFDEEATITWSNDVFPEMLGLDREDVIGRPFPEFIEAGYYDPSVVETYTDAVRTLLSSKNDVEQESLELDVHLPSGETVTNEVYISLLPLDDGEFQGTIIAFRDITEQRAYEHELERQNERLDAFTSVVSHDLRNPIAIADGYLEMALEDEDLDRVADARNAIGRMESLVEQLLVLSREGRAVEEPVSVRLEDVARDAWATVDTGDSTLAVDASKTLLADRSRLQQALENLFRNAIEHGSDDETPVTVTVDLLDDAVGFAVADDGVGIPSENYEQVFERGFTTNPDGTGFGLDIVQTIVDAHGWSICVSESDSGGARFEIRTRH